MIADRISSHVDCSFFLRHFFPHSLSRPVDFCINAVAQISNVNNESKSVGKVFVVLPTYHVDIARKSAVVQAACAICRKPRQHSYHSHVLIHKPAELLSSMYLWTISKYVYVSEIYWSLRESVISLQSFECVREHYVVNLFCDDKVVIT